jgi:hypothetical protein
VASCCGHDHTAKLTFRKAAQHRNPAIVSRDRMKTQDNRRERKAAGGNPTAPEIADDHALSRNAIELGDEG